VGRVREFGAGTAIGVSKIVLALWVRAIARDGPSAGIYVLLNWGQ
jgi:hypothetical protein